jgi:CBS domain containing-hemolysin-like protein
VPEPGLAPWVVAGVGLLVLGPAAALLTALAERSGPIRMRHWVEEAGGRLRALYERRTRFESFRYVLNLVAKLAPLALFAVLVRILLELGAPAPWAIAGVAVSLVVAMTELVSRTALGRDPEEALRRLTWLYRAALALLLPVVVLLAPFVPEREAAGATEPDDEASEEEVEAFIEVGTREGILEPADRDLVWGVVDFGDTQVRSVMTPRVDIVGAPIDEPLEELAEIFVRSSVSRLPLFRGSIDQVVAILHIRDLLAGLRAEPRPEAAQLAKPPMLVPETKLLGDLLREFQARRQQMAIVINEWGTTEGLVTVEDLIEEIVGEIADEHDKGEPENRLLADGSLLLDGRADIETLDEFFSWRPSDDTMETVGGLVSTFAGYVPAAGEVFVRDGLRFRVEKADERRVLLLRVSREDGAGKGGRG